MPDTVDVLPYDAPPDEDVVEEEEVLLSSPSPGPFHQQTFRKQAPPVLDYCHSRSPKDVLSLSRVGEGKRRSSAPVSW